MDNRILRTIGATVVLAGIAVAGVARVGAGRDAEPVEIAIDSTTSSVANTDTESVAPTTTTPPPFVYRIGLLAGPSTNNFWAYYGQEASVWNSYVMGPTKAGLFQMDSNGQLMADLSGDTDLSPTWDAEGWRVLVSLDEERNWSDGVPVTAHDFVFTLETVRASGLSGSWAYAFPETVRSARAVDDHLLEIRFTQRPDLRTWPYGPGLAPIMPAHVWRDVAADTDADTLYALDSAADVSSGPLQIERTADSVVVSSRNPGHPGQTGADVVEYHVSSDEAALVQAMVGGALDTILTPKGLTPDQAHTLKSASDVELSTSPANGVRYLGFNLGREPMADLPFRRAISLLLDRRGLAQQLMRTGTVANSFVADTNDVWFDEERAAGIAPGVDSVTDESLRAALADLEEVGYEWETKPRLDNGAVIAGTGLTIRGLEPSTLTILTPGDAYDPTRPEYVAAIADVVALLGFDVRPVETDFDTVVDLVFTPQADGALQYDMYVLGWTLGSPALPDFYATLFSKDGEANNTGYASAAFQEALAAYQTAYTHDVARTALWDMEETLARDLPYLLLYRSEVAEAYRSDRVSFGDELVVGGIQGRLGAFDQVEPVAR